MKDLIKYLMIGLSPWLQAQTLKAEPLSIRFKQAPQNVVAFIPRAGALALNVSYKGIPELRQAVAQKLGKTLIFFTGWDKAGEAHVTVITPPEMEILTAHKERYISAQRINEIALENKTQSSDVYIQGLGSAEIKINNHLESTFFLLVESENLLKIRRAIYQEFIKNGGDAKAWDSQAFYPHITIGYTLRDLHINDGVMKDIQHALDHRFDLIVTH